MAPLEGFAKEQPSRLGDSAVPLEASVAASQPSSEVSSTGSVEKVRLRICFGGQWLLQKNGTVKYVGGETYLEKVPSNLKYAELMHRLSEKVNGAVVVKYALPGEEVDNNNLITCIDDEQVQEMFEEYFKAANAQKTPSKTFRLQVWLYKAEEQTVIFHEETPHSGSHRKLGRENSTPRSATRAMFGNENGYSSFGSNNSSASAGTGPHHMHGGRVLRTTPSTAPRSLNDVEMQEKVAEEMVTWMNDQEEINEANWQAAIAHNLDRAHECTYDSYGWPHDRSPFLKAGITRAEWLALPRLAPSGGSLRINSPGLDFGGGNFANGSGALSAGNLGGGHSRLVTGFKGLPEPAEDGGWNQWNDGVGPMVEALTPAASAAGEPRFLTQDPYKEEAPANAGLGGGEGGPSAAVKGLSSGRVPVASPWSAPQPKARRSIHLPSQLGSDVGDAFNGANGDAEVAHIEHVVAGMVEHALQDGPAGAVADLAGYQAGTGYTNGGGSANMLAGGSDNGQESAWLLHRTPSRLAITHDSVYRIPQNEIKVVHSIGEGTFGEVVLATNSVFGKIAVKWLKPAKMDKHKAKFWEEARMLAALNHPNVLRFYGVVTASASEQTVVGIMTEYMPGGSLSNYLRSGIGRISLVQRAELARGAVNGLAYLHEMNIVHFDLKPDNLLLDHPLHPGFATPGVKVADFGLSKQKFRKYVSGVRDLRGTLPYMAPELVSDPDHVTETADVWSLGIVLWEMLTTETPFQHLTPQGIITGLMMGQLQPEVPEDCEPEWAWLLEGCLRSNPSHRFTLCEIAVQLDRIIEQHAVPPPLAAF